MSAAGTRSTARTGSLCLASTPRSSTSSEASNTFAEQRRRCGSTYPIAVDNDYAIWRAFGNQYWPALYFADADGQIRHHRFGEGDYEYSEIVIQLLLRAVRVERVSRDLVSVDARGVEAPADWDDLGSGETYLGYARATNFASPGGASRDRPQEYALPDSLRRNCWAIVGDWTIRRQAAVLNAAQGRIAHRFHARDLHLVMAPGPDERPVRFRVLLDGEPPGSAHGVDANERGMGSVARAAAVSVGPTAGPGDRPHV